MTDLTKKKIREMLSSNNIIFRNSSFSIKELGTGENNINYLISTHNNKYVLRIGIKTTREKNALKEFNFLKLMPKGVAPTPLFFDNTKKHLLHHYTILSYSEGKSKLKWTKKELKMHAKAMTKIHSKTFNYWITIGRKKRQFSLYEKSKRDFASYPEVFSDKKLVLLTKKFSDYIKRNDKYFLELKKFHFIHGDLCADNILFYNNKIHYIDWEWCGIRDNAEDIARTFICGKSIKPWYIGVKETDIKYLIKNYCSYSNDKNDSTLEKRVAIWNNYLLFTDMLYFFHKVKTYSSIHSKLSKKHYQNASKELFRYFSKKLFAIKINPYERTDDITVNWKY